MFAYDAFFQAVWSQDRDRIRACFSADATIQWPCTNERFTVDEYVEANCAYPGAWD